MATDPAFASTVNNGTALIGATAETNLQVAAQTVTVITAGASGTKIEEIVVEATTTSLTPTTVAGLVYIFLYDGATYHLYDTLAVTAVTASTTVAPFRTSKTYTNLFIKTGWSLRASQSIAGNVSLLKVSAFGADF
jgi:hypothetical protein